MSDRQTHRCNINSVSLSVCRGPKTQITFNKTVPSTRGPKNYLRPWVLTSYFYINFRAATAVVDGGDIFEIWRVGEEIWVRFFWAKGLGGSWFLFFSWRRGGGGGGVLRVLIGGSEPEWEMRRTGLGGSTGCIMHRVPSRKTDLHLSWNPSLSWISWFLLGTHSPGLLASTLDWNQESLT